MASVRAATNSLHFSWSFASVYIVPQQCCLLFILASSFVPGYVYFFNHHHLKKNSSQLFPWLQYVLLLLDVSKVLSLYSSYDFLFFFFSFSYSSISLSYFHVRKPSIQLLHVHSPGKFLLFSVPMLFIYNSSQYFQ